MKLSISLLIIVSSVLLSGCAEKTLAEKLVGKWSATKETLKEEELEECTVEFKKSGFIECCFRSKEGETGKEWGKVEGNKLVIDGDEFDVFLDGDEFRLANKWGIHTFVRLK